MNNPQVLGGPNSLWRKVDGPEIFDVVTGRSVVERLYDKWQYWRNPLPAPLDSRTEVFDWVRTDPTLKLTGDQATPADLDRIDEARKTDLDFLELREVNPFTQRVIKRSRDRLESEGKLVKIEMVQFGDGSHAMEQAFELAELFAQTLHQRAKGAGFIKTLLQRRVGSSLEAGLKCDTPRSRGLFIKMELRPRNNR